jgi:hypothetical protein
VEIAKLEATRTEVGKVVDMKDYYQTNKGRLLGIGGILIVVGLVLYFARGQEVALEVPPVVVVKKSGSEAGYPFDKSNYDL